MFCLFLCAFHTSSCSNARVENPGGTANSPTEQLAENRSTPRTSSQPEKTDACSVASTSADEVIYSGKDYIKNSGWTLPSRELTDITERQTDMALTVDGKKVEVILIFHDYKAPKSYSETFCFTGRNLDYMKGRLRSGGFTEYSKNGRVFRYAVFAEKVLPPLESNSEPHEETFVYQIQDANGDGVFETLLGNYDEFIVPNWVLR